MALQLSDAVRNARLDQVESIIGIDASLMIYAGAIPANCAAADTGTLLVDITLPTDWMNPAAAGVKTKLGVWSGAATAAGTATHFRLKNAAGSTVGLQGTVAQSGGDMNLDNTVIAVSQTVTINTFTLTDANP